MSRPGWGGDMRIGRTLTRKYRSAHSVPRPTIASGSRLVATIIEALAGCFSGAPEPPHARKV